MSEAEIHSDLPPEVERAYREMVAALLSHDDAAYRWAQARLFALKKRPVIRSLNGEDKHGR
jgi:hypothetical protein